MKRRRVLLVSFVWPPRGGVGLLRALSFARHFPALGWDVSVLAPTDNAPAETRADPRALHALDVEVVFAPWSEPLGRISPYLIPDPPVRWVWPALRTARRYLASRPCDAIVTTSPPASVHLIGAALRRSTGIPWVADLRDLWSDYHFDGRSRSRRAVERWLERFILPRADAVTTVSAPFARAIEEVSGVVARPIANGYGDDLRRQTPQPSFVLRYFGKVHLEAHDVRGLFTAIAALRDELGLDHSNFAVEMYLVSRNGDAVRAVAESCGVADLVQIEGAIPHGAAVERMASATALVVFDWLLATGCGQGVVPTKLYEALGVRRPVLLVAARTGAARDLVQRCRAGFCPSDDDELRSVLREMFQRFGRGDTLEVPDSAAIDGFRRGRLAAQYVELLDEIARRAASRRNAHVT